MDLSVTDPRTEHSITFLPLVMNTMSYFVFRQNNKIKNVKTVSKNVIILIRYFSTRFQSCTCKYLDKGLGAILMGKLS